MRIRVILALIGIAACLLAGVVVVCLRPPVRSPKQPESQPMAAGEPAEAAPLSPPITPAIPLPPKAPAPSASAVAQPLPERPTAPWNKAERLAQLRETFHTLAAGDPKVALQTAKLLTDQTERETALLTLVTEWTHGELDPPQQRARAITNFGLEAGLGVGLAHNPELAVLWANELTEGEGRTVVLERAALAMLETDPAGAVALSQRLAASDPTLFDSVFGGWAQKDTDAALQYAEQLPDPTERDAAIKAIRSVAPVGIGTELRVQEGMAVINRLVPGTPAELGGQLHPGDRIVAVAQGNNNVFVDARGLALSDLVQAIRGAPGSLLQLQVLPSDAPPDAAPRTVAVVRGQIKFKQ
ncbi:MAG: PDZ domain-containing protein [Verrucomicrobia bacterium]|nr:PDZ domain-containing protein [Verrucomicrobiota bacterium]